jgi:hypothetical protein
MCYSCDIQVDEIYRKCYNNTAYPTVFGGAKGKRIPRTSRGPRGRGVGQNQRACTNHLLHANPRLGETEEAPSRVHRWWFVGPEGDWKCAHSHSRDSSTHNGTDLLAPTNTSLNDLCHTIQTDEVEALEVLKEGEYSPLHFVVNSPWSDSDSR